MKEKKKLTEKEKKQLKENLKKGLIKALNISCYIISALSVLTFIVACCRGCSTTPTTNASNTTMEIEPNRAISFRPNSVTEGYDTDYSNFIVNDKVTLTYKYNPNTPYDLPNLESTLSWSMPQEALTQHSSVYCYLVNPLTINGEHYSRLYFVRYYEDESWFWRIMLTQSNPILSPLTLIEWEDSIPIVSTYFGQVFNGSLDIYVDSIEMSTNARWNFIKYLITYYSDYGARNYNYLFNYSSDIWSTINALYTRNYGDNQYILPFLFTNNYYSSKARDTGFSQTVFNGSFICNGIYYKEIRLVYWTCGDNDDFLYNFNGNTWENLNGDDIVGTYAYLKGIYFDNTLVYTVKNNIYQLPNRGTVYQIYDTYYWVHDYYASIYILNYMTGTNRNYVSGSVIGNDFDTTSLDFLNYVGNMTYGSIDYGNTTATSSNDSALTLAFEIIGNFISSLTPFLNFMVLPNLTLGVILLIPLSVTLVLFVVKLFKR